MKDDITNESNGTNTNGIKEVRRLAYSFGLIPNMAVTIVIDYLFLCLPDLETNYLTELFHIK
jgi:hypothetical protein